MSRRTITAINWAALAERCVESEKTQLASFKAKSDQYLRRLTSNPESPPKMDWAYYRKTISTPGLVDKFQKEYEALSIPYPSDKYTADIEVEEKKALQKVDEFAKLADQEIEKMREQVNRVKALLPFDQMTIEDYFITYPESAFDPQNPTPFPQDETSVQTEPEENEKGH